MNISCLTNTNDKKDIQLFFDSRGNVYFKNDNLIYQVNIDNKDQPHCDMAEYKILDDLEDNEKIKYVVDQLYITQNNNYGSDHYKYYPEDKLYVVPKSKEEDDDYEEEYISFLLTNKIDVSILNIESRECGEFCPLYDTIVFNGSIQKNEIMMKTKLNNSPVNYRLLLYTSGECIFRAIGSKNQEYNIYIDNNDILFIKTN